MRKFSIFCKTTITLLLIFTMTIYAYASSRLRTRGDIDRDDIISSADARLALRYSCKLTDLNDYQTKLADMDEDGKVSASDARLILRRAVRLDDKEIGNVLYTNWTNAYLTAFYADECGGENYSTATVERLLISTYYGATPNPAKHADKNEDGIVTYYGYNVLGTTNRGIFPLKSVIEYKVGGRIFYGVVLDHNGDNMAGRKYVTLDHLFCSSSEGNRFIDRYTGNNYLPISDARRIGTMNVANGQVDFFD